MAKEGHKAVVAAPREKEAEVDLGEHADDARCFVVPPAPCSNAPDHQTNHQPNLPPNRWV